MKHSPIGELLTRYYAAPARLVWLEKQRQRIEVRIAYLNTAVGETTLDAYDGFTLPGTVGRYAAPTGHGSAVSNPTVAAWAKLAIQDPAVTELRIKYEQLFDTEQEISEIRDLQASLSDVLSNLNPVDAALITLRYRDGKTNEQIAIIEQGYADESGPRKRIQEIEEDIRETMYPEPVGILRKRCIESMPNRRRKIAESDLLLVLS